MKKYIIGITGASGSVIAQRLIELLARLPFEKEIYVVATENGLKVFEHETDSELINFLNSLDCEGIKYYNNDNMFAPIASGSFALDCMFIVPCSMATLGKIAVNAGSELICRAADVCLKERVRLVIAPRESPLNSIHLRNMLTLSDIGAIIAPPLPAFYSDSGDYNTMVHSIAGRILKAGNIENDYYKIWKGK